MASKKTAPKVSRNDVDRWTSNGAGVKFTKAPTKGKTTKTAKKK